MTIQTFQSDAAVADTLEAMGYKARAAFHALGKTSAKDRTHGLMAISAAIRAAIPEILAANDEDMTAARAKGLDAAMLDRLALDARRVEGIAAGIASIAAFPDLRGVNLRAGSSPTDSTLRGSRCRLASSVSYMKAGPT